MIKTLDESISLMKIGGGWNIVKGDNSIRHERIVMTPSRKGKEGESQKLDHMIRRGLESQKYFYS